MKNNEAYNDTVETVNELADGCMIFFIEEHGCPEEIALQIVEAGRTAMLKKMLELQGISE